MGGRQWLMASPSTRICGDCKSLCWEEPMERGRQLVIGSIPSKEVMHPYKVMMAAKTVARLL